MSRKLMVAAVVGVSGVWASSALAQTRTWDGGTTGAWTTAGNWSDDNAPDEAGENAQIDGNDLVNTTVTYTLPTGSAVVGAVSIGAGDTLLFRGGSTNASGTLTLSSLANQGTTDVGAAGSGNVRSANFTVTGANNFANAVGATVTAGNSSTSNRVNSIINIDAQNTNLGRINVNKGGTLSRSTTRFNLENSGTFTNNGTISVAVTVVDSGEGGALFTFAGDTTLAGNGELVLSTLTADRAAVFATTSGAILTNGQDHTIRGAGIVGAGDGNMNQSFSLASTANLVNDGLIKATENDLSLRLLPLSTLTNASTGRIIAAGTAGISIGSASAKTFTNNGLLEARTGSQIVIGTGTTVSLAGDLRGGGTITAASLTFGAGGRLTPGDSTTDAAAAPSTVGNLQVIGNLALAADTVLDWQVGSDASAGATYDTVSVTGDLTLDGVLELQALAGFPDVDVDFTPYAYRLFNVTGTVIDNGLTVDPRFYYTLSSGAGGSTDVMLIVPEPAGLSLVALVGSGLLARRRRLGR